MQREPRRAYLGRRLVEVFTTRESVTGYTAGFVATVDGEPVGFVRSHPRHATRDLVAHAIANGGNGGERD